jgi:hypothetical protein
MSDEPWRLVYVEDVILVAGPDAAIVQEAQELGADALVVWGIRGRATEWVNARVGFEFVNN